LFVESIDPPAIRPPLMSNSPLEMYMLLLRGVLNVSHWLEIRSIYNI